MPSGQPAPGDLRVAIVGVGPRGLFALERLLHHAYRVAGSARLHVDLFEPYPVAGAGPVYDPGQPDFLRMNLPADRVDMWSEGSRAAPEAQQLDFAAWQRTVSGLAERAERYPPRGRVGRYLADGLARLVGQLPAGVTVTRRTAEVQVARLSGLVWRIEATDRLWGAYDEVLLTVGHRSGGDQWPTGEWDHRAPLIPTVFPVTRQLSPARVAAGTTVAVRGFALTFLDAALALTEGRGGRFQAVSGHPYRVRYDPSGVEVGVILPFSRTGRPMLAKPEPGVAAAIRGAEEIAQRAQAQILALPRDFCPERQLVRILASAASATLLAAEGPRQGGERAYLLARSCSRWLAAAYQGAGPPAGINAAQQLERSLAVGCGHRPPDVPWAAGHVWRALYPALVSRLGGRGLPAPEWPAFSRFAAQMERVAFGPPAVNAAKLLALLSAGRVDPRFLAGGGLVSTDGATSLCGGRERRTVDVVVNAVLPPPGAAAPAGVLAQLARDGHVRIPLNRRGIEIGPDGGCVGRSGRRTPGLSCVGRATEDWVIGNDTLNRALHPHSDRWAERVVACSSALGLDGCTAGSVVPNE